MAARSQNHETHDVLHSVSHAQRTGHAHPEISRGVVGEGGLKKLTRLKNSNAVTRLISPPPLRHGGRGERLLSDGCRTDVT